MRTLLLCFFVLALHLRAPACAFDDMGDDYRIALLNPYLIGEEYQAFFYSAHEFYHYTNAKAGRDRLRNARSWADELRGEVSAEGVMQMMYETPFSDYVAARDSNARNALSRNPAWQAVNRDSELLRYLMWAKAYEVPQRAHRYYWDDSQAERVADSTYYEDFRARALEGYYDAKGDEFLRHRYAYQLLLLARYAGDEEEMDRLFQEHFAGRNDVLSDWARFHYATQWNDEGKVMVELARAFRVTPEKALAVYQRTPDHFDPADYLYAAQNDHERSDLYALAAVKKPGKVLKYIREAYRYYPDNPVLPLLIVREINKLEDWLTTHPLTSHGPALSSSGSLDWQEYEDYRDFERMKEQLRRNNVANDLAYLSEMREFMSDYTPDPQAVGLSQTKIDLFRAQLALLASDYRSAEKQLAAGKYTSLDSLTELQLGVAQFLIDIEKNELDRDALTDLLSRLQPLFPEDATPGQSIGVLNRIAAQTYAAAGDTLTAYFFHINSLRLADGSGWNSQYYSYLDYLDRPVSASLMEDIIATVESAPATAFYDYVLPPLQPRWEGYMGGLESYQDLAYALRDLLGTQAMRRNEVAAAVAYFEPIPDAFYKSVYEFSDRLRGPSTGVRVVNPRIATVALSKYAVATRVLDRQRAAEGGDAEALLRLGDEWYGMSYFGPAWIMLSYEKSIYPPDSAADWPSLGATPTTEHTYKLIYQASRAERYWQQALASTNDQELRAEIDFKLRMLDWNRARLALERDWRSDEEDYSSLYYAKFNGYQEAYRGTDFEREVVQQCSWYGRRYR